ncbi:MAG: hypothetical protein A3J46_00225 [Candidatus Yanofskybacteria bacterium RIFCSPHIGHO2_02_FULL_41_11]|uniref:Uncharacterized protein n=1 Tax=Candidatus Yanofskybacteria bacterium RIFCSPHIGHO2_02_FULL_41_11 TaxID=1802675 RepID=A0A1F8F7B6_9BACT|nr:MAG: hypothetical protein A3J46_00225 [Candidatus Yanofskybacteria bacterium RIFCSPHIGHO2_02_FULL_41_11]
MIKKLFHKLNYSNTVFKLFLFLIIFAFGTAITYGNWLVGLIGGVIVIFSLEVDEAYKRGWREGYKEALNKLANEREK